jgi:hypothetical protein
LFLAVAATSCHNNYHNLDTCLQVFPHLGAKTAYYVYKFCLVNGGTAVIDDEAGLARLGDFTKKIHKLGYIV